MQELAKSLEALGLSTLDGLTKKELRKVKEAIMEFSDSVSYKQSTLTIDIKGFQKEVACTIAGKAPSPVERPFQI